MRKLSASGGVGGVEDSKGRDGSRLNNRNGEGVEDKRLSGGGGCRGCNKGGGWQGEGLIEAAQSKWGGSR